MLKKPKGAKHHWYLQWIFIQSTSAKGTKNMRKPKWPQDAANDGALPIFTVR